MRESAFEVAIRRYDESRPLRQRPTTEQTAKWLSYLLDVEPNRSARILDLGCGSGEVVEFLLSRGYENVMGVDASEQEVARARARLGDRVVLAGAREFLENEQQEPFDLVCMLSVIEHFTVPVAWELLTALRRRVSHQGHLVVATLNCANPLSLYRRYVDITHRVGYTPESLTQLLILAGFEVERICAANELQHGPWAAAARALHALYAIVFRLFLRSYGIHRFPSTLHPSMTAIARPARE